ncbi:hypothetical protein ColTof4_01359 [Colletotrichum tofieldiae]|nr:hypothetical protein ColTof3_08613 [Colletotrichum tofieldiae]GKT68936.1 hypothetical protein ColTof4_01359 [Colletotrichum tofieldiae]GKT96796.1 hypothetical protein Ct61P_14646 [Colletotrichum tofieldiae]
MSPTADNALATDMESLRFGRREEVTGPRSTTNRADVDRTLPATVWRPAPSSASSRNGTDGTFPRRDDTSRAQDEAIEYSRQQLVDGYRFCKEVYRPNKRRQQAKGEEQ